jgi:predicted O-methyltransferase YrrM
MEDLMGVLGDEKLQALVDRLQAQSVAQDGEMGSYFGRRARAGDLNWDSLDEDANRFLADKLVALEPIKAEFCHLLCHALRARRVIEVGGSFGVSTLYLAAAVREIAKASGEPGVVITTEWEPAKAAAARANYAEAGLGDVVDLREGDLRQTLKVIEGPVDFVLMDIWTEMVRPAIELIAPHLRAGAVVVCDNTGQFRQSYRDFFAFVQDPANGLRTLTLPFQGGLELCVKL